MSDTEPIDEQLSEGRKRGRGPVMQVRDGRVTKGIEWIMVIVGVLIAAALTWVANSINTLNTTVATMSNQSQNIVAGLAKNDARDDRQEDRINGIDGRTYSLEARMGAIDGRNTRGEGRRGQ